MFSINRTWKAMTLLFCRPWVWDCFPLSRERTQCRRISGILDFSMARDDKQNNSALMTKDSKQCSNYLLGSHLDIMIINYYILSIFMGLHLLSWNNQIENPYWSLISTHFFTYYLKHLRHFYYKLIITYLTKLPFYLWASEEFSFVLFKHVYCMY